MQNNLETTSRFSTPEAEISFLREQIASKEKELTEKKLHFEKDDVIKAEISRYRDVLSKQVLDEKYAMTKESAEAIILNLSPESHDKKMEELLGIFKEKGIKNAMSVLAGLRDPHIEDDFHRFLVQYIKSDKGRKSIDIEKPDFRGINMTLYEVVLPDSGTRAEHGAGGQGATKPLKELISGMEQFFSGMLSVANKSSPENYIILEIANAGGSDQFIFYVAVPNVHKDLFERQIMSVFYNARLMEAANDYNIFNEGGVSLGSYLELTEKPVYPFKTYEQFDHDPLNVILNSFSKIEKEGQGAAVQIIFAPKADYYNKKYKYAVEQIEKGVPTKEAIDMPESLMGDFGKTLKGFFKATPKVTEEKKPIDVEAIEKIKIKIGSAIVATNIRLVSSAESRDEAEKILHSLESSFNQFSLPASNSLSAVRLEKAKLVKFLREYSFRIYNTEHNLPLNLHELTSLIHFHTLSLSPTPQLKQAQNVTAPAPSEIAKSGTVLGVNNYRNTDTRIYIMEEDRLRHFYAIGQTGTGKSTILKNMIIQDIEKGHGVCMIDPHGIDILDILANIPPSRFQDVIYFDPSFVERSMALNMLEYDLRYPEQKTFVVNELFNIFQKLYGAVPESMGPMFEQYFRNATMLVIEDPESGSTLLDVSRVLSNKTYRQQKLEKCKNPVVVEFWREVAEKAGGEAALSNIVPYITSKFDVFLANDIMRPIVAQQKSSFDFRQIMDNKKILLVNLSKGRLGDINANLIGLILVGKILMAALSRSGSVSGNLSPFYLYIDEFQNITTKSISTILSEARKYKLSLTIAHQFIAQLEEGIRDAVFGNVGTICSFRVGAEDAEYLEKQFAPVFSAHDIMNIENRNAIIKMLVNGVPAKAFNIKTLPSPAGDPSVVETLKQLSHLTYGGEREVIEREILSKYKK
ncbi:MAG: type IV secretory system conjugative DNA transfer family protein [Candidatus Zambryskibacteria bacterium]|nr:type IV secretory system conjugative DNA transfer family protein [Candidatus Zambryskibacteria bacterium]